MKINYILVTPAKDEESNLRALIDSIAAQICRPLIWVIVDDASEDGTPEIIKIALAQYPWIHSLRLNKKHGYDLGEQYSSVCIKGFEYAFDYCKQNDLQYEFIALSDADMLYPVDYFASCIEFLQHNKDFGIVSGKILIKNNEGKIREEKRIQLGYGHPRGSGRVWRKETFESTGGYFLTKSPDSVSNVMAILRGWKIAQLNDIKCFQTRDMGGKSSLWNGYFQLGERAHYLNSNPLSVPNSMIVELFVFRGKYAVVRSMAFLFGFLKAWITREEQINNSEIRNYMGSYKRVLKNYRMFFREIKAN